MNVDAETFWKTIDHDSFRESQGEDALDALGQAAQEGRAVTIPEETDTESQDWDEMSQEEKIEHLRNGGEHPALS